MAVNQSLTLTQVSQNFVNNTSQVRLLWLSTQTGASMNAYQRTATYQVRVNGASWSAYSVSYSLPQNQTVTVADVTMTVNHDEEGFCRVEVQTHMETGISAGTVELKSTLEPDRIPRYSVVTATDAAIGDVSQIRIQKCSNTYKHCLRYSLTGGAPWTYLDEGGMPASREVIFSGDRVNFRLPDSFYDRIPNGKTGICTLECWTYITDTQYLPQGQITTFTYTADPARCGPQVNCTLADTNNNTLAITGSATTLVRYMSNVHLDVTAQAQKGATIRDPSQDVSVWYNGDWHYGTQLDFPNVESDTFKLWARDSRGYTVYRDVLAPEYIAYVRLTNQTVAQRLNPTGSRVDLRVSGSCYGGNFGGANKIQNIVRIWYRLAQTREGLATAPWYEVGCTLEGNSYTTTIPLEDIPYDTTCWAETWAQDKLGYVTKVVKIGRGVPVFDWGESDFCFHVPVEVPALTVNGVALDAYIKSVIQGGNV